MGLVQIFVQSARMDTPVGWCIFECTTDSLSIKSISYNFISVFVAIWHDLCNNVYNTKKSRGIK